jgi:cobalt-zinc-cadmium efflux system outer membrane protein
MMAQWCRTLVLAAAMAALGPLCAPVIAAERPGKASVHGTSRPEVVRGAMPEGAGAAMQMREGTTGAEPQPAPAVEPEGGMPARLTLDYVSRLAEENHPILRRDRARITAAEGQSLQAGLYPNPNFDTNNPQVFNGHNSAFNAGFQQTFVTHGKLRLDRAAAQRAQQQSEFALMQDRYVLLTNVRSQFYTVLAAEARVDVLNRLLQITDATVKTVREQKNAGIAAETEVLLADIDFNRTQADLLNAQRVLVGERGQLSAIVGFPGLVQGRVAGSLTATAPSFDEQIMQQFVSSEHALVQIAKLDIDKSKILLKRAEVEPKPNITLGPAYQWGLNKQQEQFWLTVVFPIPVSDRNQGNIKSARANVRDSVETLGTVQLDLLRQVAESFNKYRGALEQAERYRVKIIPDSLDALRLAKSSYKEGIIDFATYLQAQRTVLQSNRDYVDILETVWTTAATLAGLLQRDQFP